MQRTGCLALGNLACDSTKTVVEASGAQVIVEASLGRAGKCLARALPHQNAWS